MLIQFEEYLTFENIYIFSNYGILPFWLLLIAVPNSKITQILVNANYYSKFKIYSIFY